MAPGARSLSTHRGDSVTQAPRRHSSDDDHFASRQIAPNGCSAIDWPVHDTRGGAAVLDFVVTGSRCRVACQSHLCLESSKEYWYQPSNERAKTIKKPPRLRMLVAEAWRLCWPNSILVVAYSGWVDLSLRWLVTRKRWDFFPSPMDLEGLRDFRNVARCVPEQGFGHLPLKSEPYFVFSRRLRCYLRCFREVTFRHGANLRWG